MRVLAELKSKNFERISSKDLSEEIGYTASQIRQDLNHFGGFGQQGYGYNIDDLHEEIEKILGLDRKYRLVIVGCGKLGCAIANFNYTYNEGFKTIGMFDINPEVIGMNINGVLIEHVDGLSKFLKDNAVDIGVICVTKESAQQISQIMTEGNVSGIWNFAPWDLVSTTDVPVENVHLSDGLQTLVYYINHK